MLKKLLNSSLLSPLLPKHLGVVDSLAGGIKMTAKSTDDLIRETNALDKYTPSPKPTALEGLTVEQQEARTALHQTLLEKWAELEKYSLQNHFGIFASDTEELISNGHTLAEIRVLQPEFFETNKKCDVENIVSRYMQAHHDCTHLEQQLVQYKVPIGHLSNQELCTAFIKDCEALFDPHGMTHPYPPSLSRSEIRELKSKYGEKIVDEFARIRLNTLIKPYTGEPPKAIYHGTASENVTSMVQNGFDFDKIGRGEFGTAGYFALHPKSAANYGTVLQAESLCTNIAEVDGNAWSFLGGNRGFKKMLDDMTYLWIKEGRIADHNALSSDVTSKAFREMQRMFFQKRGFDGIYSRFSDNAGVEYLAILDPAQIKSIRRA